jgi:hypothetical protein
MESKHFKQPFTVKVLDDDGIKGSEAENRDFNALLPATIRTKKDHIRVPDGENLEFLEQELLVKKLNDVQSLLWMCGRPMPPRALHYQSVMTRDVTITENVELHLVWAKNRIFIKPMSRWLLDPDFWSSCLICPEGEWDERRVQLVSCALGFIFTYTALISYESDFAIAQTKGLLPKTVTWERWREFSAQVLENHNFDNVNPRYWYGELRLGRLNKIYRFRLGYIFRGYSKVSSHFSYNDLLSDNFAALATILAYVAVVLTAMQVGLATERLVSNKAFQDASYGFTIFTIIAPLIAGGIIVLAVLAMIISNWIATKIYQRRRARELGVQLIQQT